MPDNLPNQNLYVTVNGAAKLLGVSIDTVRRWDAQGTLHSVRLDGKNRYFLKSELKTFKKNQPLSISEAATALSVSVSTLRRLEGKGVIVAERSNNGERLYSQARINEILASRKKGGDKRVDLFAPIPTNLSQAMNATASQGSIPQGQTTYAQAVHSGTNTADEAPSGVGNEEGGQQVYKSAFYNSAKASKKQNFWKKNYMLKHVGQFASMGSYVGTSKNGFKGIRFGNHAPEYKKGIAILTFMLVLSSGIFAFTVLRDVNSHDQNSVAAQAPESQRALARLTPQQRAQVAQAQVLAASTTKGQFTVNIKSLFNDDIVVSNHDLTLGTGKLTASNVIYSLTGGLGITVTGGQNPVASNSGILSIGGTSGDIALGTGLSVSNNVLSSTAVGTNSFENIVAGGNTITAGSPTDTLTFAAGSNISLSSSGKTITISSTGAVATNYWTLSGDNLYPNSITNFVGIGNTSPTVALDVTGDFAVSGTTSFNSIAYTWPGSETNGYILQTNGSGTLSWVNPGSLPSVSLFTQANGSVYPNNPTVDFLVGGTSSASAKFAFVNVDSGTPTIQIAGTGGNTYITGTGNLGTTGSQNITIGGATSGNIALTPGNGAGALTLNVGSLSINGNPGITNGSAACVTTVNGVVTGTGTCQLGTEQWVLANGTLYPGNPSVDLLVGGSSSASAKFGFVNVNSGTPSIQISGTTVLTGTTLGSGVTSSSLTTTGALVSGSIASGFGTIATANTITGTTLNGTTGINTGAGAGTQRIDSSGNLTNIGTTQFNSLTYTWPGSQTTNYVLQTNGSGVLSWVNPSGAGFGTNYFTINNGAIYPTNISLDFLVGGSATSSSKFAVINVNTGTPTASLSAGTAGGIYLTADGSLAATANQPLTLGGSTTGNITLSPLNGTGTVNVNGAVAATSTITGTTLNGTTGINTGAGAGTLRIDSSGNLSNIGTISSTYLTTTTNVVNLAASTVLQSNGTTVLDASRNLLNIGTTQFNTVTYTWPAADAAQSNYVLVSNGSGTLSWLAPGDLPAVNYWDIANGAIYPKNSSLDLLVGATSTGAAKFGFINVNSGTPAIQISGTTVLTGSTLGSGVTSSSLTTTGALVSGSIASGFGTISTANTITGTTLNGTTGINTGAGAGTQRIDSSGNLVNIGTTQFNTITYTWPGSQSANYVLQTNGSGTLSWVNPTALGTNYFTIASGAIYPTNTTLDFLVGGTSSAAAKFGFVNVNSGTPAFQISGTNVLTGTTLGSGVTSSSLTTTGALVSGSIASGFGTIATANTITGTTLNGTTGINTGAGAGAQRIDASGNLTNIGTTQFNSLTYTWPGSQSANYILQTNGSGTLSWVNPAILGTNYFTIASGAIYPTNTTLDFLVGGTSSAAAKFGFINVNSGTPALQISGNTVLTGTTLGSGVTSSSLTTTGALVSGSIASGFGTISTANTITGTVLNGTSGLNTGPGAGTQRINASGDLINIGSTQFNTVTYTWPNTDGSPGYALTTNGSGTLSWVSSSGLGTNYFTIANGTIYPTNTTLDFLVGGSSSASAKFAFLNVSGGTPTASISAGAAGGLYVTATGTLQTTANQNLTVGGSTTGNILLNAGAGKFVGVGTANPSAGLLEIGTTTSTVTRLVTRGANNTSDFTAYDESGNIVHDFSHVSNAGIYNQYSGGVLENSFSANGDNYITGGNFGVGVTNPTSLLSVGGLSQFQVNSSGAIVSIDGVAHTIDDVAGNLSLTSNSNVISLNSNVTFAGTTTLNSIAYTWPGSQGANYILQTNGSGTLSWTDPAVLGTNYFTIASGAIYPTNTTLDFLVGGSSSASAKFAFLNVNNGTPTASISAGAAGGVYLTAAGNLATTANQNLTLGGSTTGNITFDPLNGSGTVNSTGNLNLSSGKSFLINNSSVLSATTLGSGVTSSSLTTTGALVSGSIVSGFGTIATANTITGTVLNGTTGVNTGAGAGTQRIDNSGNLTNIGTTQFNTITYTWPSSGQVAGYALTTNGSGTLSWTDVTSFGTNYWTIASGTLYPNNPTLDLLVGGTSTATAKFAFINVNSGTPAIQISGNTVLTGTTLGSGVTSSSLTTTGALVSGSIASGFGTISTANTITGTTLNGTTGINTGAGAGTQRIDSSGNLVNIGTTQFNTITYTWPGSQSANYVLQTNGSGTLSWIDPTALGTNYFTISSGAIYPTNTTLDFLIGGSSSVSAKFAFLNVDSGTPTASISAGAAGGAYLTAAGTLQTTASQLLTLGGSTTGNIALMPMNGTGYVGIGTANPARALEIRQATVAGNTELFVFNTNNTNAASSSRIRVTSGGSSAGDPYIVFDVNGASGFALGVDNSDSDKFKISTNINNVGASTVLTIDSSGNLGLGTTTPTALLDVAGTASISGALKLYGTPTIQSTANQNLTLGGDTTGDITLSPRNGSGTTIFNGTTTLNGIAYTWPGSQSANYVLQTNGSGTLSWVNPTTLGTNYFTIASGAIYPTNTSLDFLIGSASSASAKFGFVNVNAGTPAIQISGTTVLTGTTLGSGVTSSSLTTTGALVSGSIASGFGTIATANTITGTTLNGTTGINTGAGAGTQRIDNSGNLTNIGTTQFNTVTYTWPGSDGSGGYTLTTNGSGTLSWTNPAALGTNYFTIASGAIYPTNTTVDFLVGGTSSASAKFAFLNVNNGTPTASISAGAAGGAYLTADGNLATTANQSLTIGGATTGNITLNPLNGSGTVNSTGNLNLSSGKSFLINNSSVLSATTLGSGVTSSSLTTTGALVSGSIASGFGTIATANTITGTTLNGTTGINTGAGAGTQRIDASGNLVNIGTTQFNTVTYTWPSSDGTGGYALTTNGTGTLSWSSTSGFGTNYFTINNGTIYPTNTSLDFLVGGASSASAKFAVLNTTSGTPTASVSAGTSGGAYLTAAGNLATTANQGITIGGATSGNITLSPLNGSGSTIFNGTTTLNNIAYTWPGSQTATYVLQTDGSGVLSWVNPSGAGFGTNYFTIASGAIYPTNTTLDFLIGSASSASAKFGFVNVNAGTPAIQISGNTVLTGTTLGSGVTSSSLTTTGALVSGSIASGFGTIATANTITGTVLNGTTGINTGAGAGTQRVDVSGNLTNIGTTQFNTVTYTWPASDAAASGYALTSNGAGALSWSQVATGTNYFTSSNGLLYPINSTLDFAIGGTSTAAAKFAILNVAGGTPTASLSAGAAGGAYLTAAGTLQTTANQDLTIGGATTGNITLSPLNGSGTVTSTGNLNLSSGKSFLINNTSVLSATTLGSGVTSSSLTTTGALVSGSIASGFGTIATANTITGTTLNGTTGINTGAGAGTQRIDNSGNLTNIGTTQFNTVTYTWPGSDAAASGYALTSNGSGALSWSPVLTGTNYFTASSGLLYPINSTLDFAIGGTSTAAAKFAVLNVAGGTPTASLSAGAAGGAYLTAAGAIQTTAGQDLTLGGSTTGNITISPSNGSGLTTLNGNTVINADLFFKDISGFTSSVGEIKYLSGGTGNGLFNFIGQGTNNIMAQFRDGSNGIFDVSTTNGISEFHYSLSVDEDLYVDGTTTFNTVTYTWPGSDGSGGYALTTDGAGALSWSSTGGFGTNYFTIANGSIYPTNSTLDFLIGAASTASAKFAFINVNSGTPAIQISGNTVLTGSTLGSGVTSSSLTTTGALVSGSIASGFGTISTANTITGTTLNGTTGINTGAGAGTQRIDNSGNLTNIGTTQFNTVTYTWPGSDGLSGYALTTNGSGTLSWVSAGGLGTNYFTIANGTIYPTNTSLDFLVGGSSSASAKFAFLNVNNGTPTASISAGAAGGAYLTAAGNLATTANQDLTLGGATTGNITLNPLNGSGTVTSTGNLNLSSGKTFNINGTSVLSSSTLGSGVTSSSLTTTGALVSGSIASGFGTIATANTITGTTLNGTTGVNTGAGAGTQRIDASGNLTNIGTTQFNTITYTWPGSQGANYILQTNGSGTLSWVDPATVGTNYFTIASGAIYPTNTTLDFLVGGTSSASAKFAFLNVSGGTPTASISAGAAGGAYLTATGLLTTTANQGITIGGATAGDITLSPLNSLGKTILNGKTQIATTTSFDNTIDGFQQLGTGDLTMTARGDLRFNIDSNNNGTQNFRIFANGNTTEVARIDESGNFNSLTGGFMVNSTQVIDSSRNIANVVNFTSTGTTSFNTVAYAWPNSATAGYVLQSGSTGATSTLSWADPATFGTNYWSLGTGTIYPTNTSLDFLVGASSTASAKFAVLNVAGGTPTASLSAGAAGGAYLTATGNLTTTANQDLTIGGATTGDITLTARNNAGKVTVSGTPTAAATTSLFQVGSTALSGASTDGTYLGINAASGYTGDLLSFQKNSVTQLSIDNTGSIYFIPGNGSNSDCYTWGGNCVGRGMVSSSFDLNLQSGNSSDITLDPHSGIVNFQSNGGSTNNVIINAGSGFVQTGIAGTLQGSYKLSGVTSGTITLTSAAAAGTYTLTLPTTDGDAGQALTTDGTGTLSWATYATGTNYLTSSNGLLYPVNSSLDFAIGGTSTASAKFAVLNVAGGTPTASLSAGAAGGAFLTANGYLSTTARQDLTLGNSSTYDTTGNILLSPNGTGNVGIGTTNPAYKLTVQTASADYGFVHTDGTTSVGSYVNTAAQSGYFGTLSDSWLQFFVNNGTSVFSIDTNNRIGIGQSTTPMSALHVSRAAASGTTGKALVVFDQTENQDIFTASSSGATKFTITNAGSIVLDSAATTTFGGVTYTWPGSDAGASGYVLSSDGAGALSWIPQSGGPSSSVFVTGNGLIYPANTTQDFAIGGSASSSAKFAVLNVNNGTPTASLSAGAAGGMYLTANGTLQTTANQDLTIGGSTTGNIFLNPLNGTGTVTVNGGIVATSTITGTTLSGTTGINTGAGAGTQRIDSSGNLSNIGTISSTYLTTTTNVVNLAASTILQSNGTTVLDASRNLLNIGTTQFNTVTYTWPAADAAGAGYALTSNGAGTLSWSAVSTGTNYFTSTNGLLYPINSTLDFAIGGTASSAAKFAVLNVNNGTPTATLSAGAAGGLYLTADGNIQTTANQNLTIGGATTGDILLSPRNGTGFVNLTSTNATQLRLGYDSSNYYTTSVSNAGAVVFDATGSSAGFNFVDGLSLGTQGAVNGSLTFYSAGGAVAPSISADSSKNLNITAPDGIVYVGAGSGGDITLDPGAGNLIANLTSTGDFLIQRAGNTFASFNHVGNEFNVTGGTLGGQALVILNETGGNDILTASASGTTRFRINNTGDLILGNNAATTTFGGIAYTWPTSGQIAGYALTTDGAGTLSWQPSGAPIFTIASGLTFATNTTTDFAIGGTSTASAKFAVLNVVGSGTPTASVSAGANGAAYITANGTLATTASQGLTLGSSTTGGINLTTTGVFPQRFTSGVTTGSTTNSAFVFNADSVTTGTGLNFSATGLTTGSAINIAATNVASGGTAGSIMNLAVTNSPTSSATDYYAFNNTITDGTSLANTVRGIRSDISLSGNAAKAVRGITATISSTSTTGDNLIGLLSQPTASGALASAQTRTIVGIWAQPNSTAATSQANAALYLYGSDIRPSSTLATAGTTNVYGSYISTTATHAANAGTLNNYGEYIANGTSSTNGTSTKYGLYIEEQTLADSNFSAVFAGNTATVGIGKTNPIYPIDLGGTSSQVMRFDLALSQRGYFIFDEQATSSMWLWYDGAGSGDANAIKITDSANTLDRFTFTRGGLLGIGVSPAGAYLDIAAATTALAQINLTTSAGVDVSSPTSGDLWWNGTNLYFRNASTTLDLLAASAGITGSGTTNRIAKFTSSGAIGNSSITDDSTGLTSALSDGGTGAAGGVFVVNTGNGGASGASNGGNGGNFIVTVGNGGSAPNSANAGAGGVVSIIAGTGGNTATGRTGAGGALTLSAGSAGVLTSTSGTGAAGGAVSISAGDGSGGLGTSGLGGVGGSFTLTAGAGGGANGSSANAGNGGNFTVTLGAGGTSTAGANGGSGGAYRFTAGAGGNTATGTSGTGGAIIFDAGNGGVVTSTSGIGAAGGSITLNAGTGANSLGTSSLGGVGGSFNVNIGGGGSANGSSANAGNAGQFNVTFGTGGTATVGGNGGAGAGVNWTLGSGGNSGSSKGGAGGNFLIRAGNGGIITSSSGTGGTGGTVALNAGSGANSLGVSAIGGAGGNVVLTMGNGGSINSSGNGGNAGQFLVSFGTGGSSSGSGNGGAGSGINWTLGSGGNSSGGTPGAGGGFIVRAGNGGVQTSSGAGLAAGGAITLNAGSGSGANTTGGPGGVGGSVTLSLGAGGAANSSGNGGNAGAFIVNFGTAGSASSSGDGGQGGGVNWTLSNGGNTGSGTAGQGGAFTIKAGSAGVVTGAGGIGANGGQIALNAGDGSATNTSSSIGGQGGRVVLASGNGGIGNSSSNGGNGGEFIVNVGDGGTAAGSGAGGKGAGFALTLGVGGNSSSGTSGAGGAFTVTAGAGGTATGAGGIGAAGGAFTFTAGAGGATNTSSSAAGEGGRYIFTSGAGGIGNSTSNGGNGGNYVVVLGVGGNAAGSGKGGNGGGFFVTAGNGGTSASGTVGFGGSISLAAGHGIGGNGGNVSLQAGNGSTQGKIDIGTSFTSAVTISKSGVQTTVQDALSVGSFTTANTAGVCWDNSGASLLYDCNGAPTDLAENYGTTDATIAAGDIVALTGQATTVVVNGASTSKAWIKKATSGYQGDLLGIVSTSPNQTYGEDGLFDPSENPRPVSLAGRVPVKVTSENGDIHTGDSITSSETIPGAGMKATKAGMIIGTALQDYSGSGVGTIVVSVRTAFYAGDIIRSSGISSFYNPDGSLKAVFNGKALSADQIDTLVSEKVASSAFSGVLSSLKVAGVAEFGVAGTSTGTIKVNNIAGGSVAITSASSSANWTMTLPTDAGQNGEVLTTDGNGKTSWTSVSSLTSALRSEVFSVIGEASDSASQNTIFGKLAKIQTQDIADINTQLSVFSVFTDSLTLVQSAVFNVQATFTQGIEVLQDIVLAGRIKHTDQDTAGIAVIKTGDTEVHINFDRPYATAPIINITAQGSVAQGFVKNVTTDGFTVALPASASADMQFNWSAVLIQNPRISESSSSAQLILSPTPTLTPTPTP